MLKYYWIDLINLERICNGLGTILLLLLLWELPLICVDYKYRRYTDKTIRFSGKSVHSSFSIISWFNAYQTWDIAFVRTITSCQKGSHQHEYRPIMRACASRDLDTAMSDAFIVSAVVVLYSLQSQLRDVNFNPIRWRFIKKLHCLKWGLVFYKCVVSIAIRFLKCVLFRLWINFFLCSLFQMWLFFFLFKCALFEIWFRF